MARAPLLVARLQISTGEKEDQEESVNELHFGGALW